MQYVPSTHPAAAWGYVAALLLWQAFGLLLAAGVAWGLSLLGRGPRTLRRTLAERRWGEALAVAFVIPFGVVWGGGWVVIWLVMQAQIAAAAGRFFTEHGGRPLLTAWTVGAALRFITAVAAAGLLVWMLARPRLPTAGGSRAARVGIALALAGVGFALAGGVSGEMTWSIGGGDESWLPSACGWVCALAIPLVFVLVGTACLSDLDAETPAERGKSLLTFYTVGLVGWGFVTVVACGLLVGTPGR